MDTARQVWGGGWHMPTEAQLRELTANTTYEFITINGINVGKFTAQNGNYVLLPAAGEYHDSSPGTVNSFGNYWSSTPYDNAYAYGLRFYKINSSTGKYVDRNERNEGCSIRPVVG